LGSPRLRLDDFQQVGTQSALRFQENWGKGREFPVRYVLEGFIRPDLDAAGSNRSIKWFCGTMALANYQPSLWRIFRRLAGSQGGFDLSRGPIALSKAG
jgi:hypothetical protein